MLLKIQIFFEACSDLNEGSENYFLRRDRIMGALIIDPSSFSVNEDSADVKNIYFVFFFRDFNCSSDCQEMYDEMNRDIAVALRLSGNPDNEITRTEVLPHFDCNSSSSILLYELESGLVPPVFIF